MPPGPTSVTSFAVVEQRPYLGDLAIPTEQARAARGERVVRADDAAERSEVAGTELEDSKRLGEIAELVFAEVDERVAVDDRRHGLRQQHLATVADGLDPSAGVDDRTEVVAAAHLGFAKVQAHPHLECRPGPRRGRQVVLRRDGSIDRRRCLRERNGEGVAGGGEHVPATGLDGGPEDLVVHPQARRHRVGIGGPQPGRSFDISEQEAHHARRLPHVFRPRHRVSLTRCVCDIFWRDSLRRRSTRDGEEMPGAGNAFQFVIASVFELDARTGDEVDDCSGCEYFTRRGQAGDPRRDVDTDTGDVLVA